MKENMNFLLKKEMIKVANNKTKTKKKQGIKRKKVFS